jgi:hypothetical protein
VPEIQKRSPSMLKNVDGGSLGGGAGDSGVPTINSKKMSTTGPVGGGVGDLGAPSISAKKHR